MSPTRGIIPHRLLGNYTVSCCADPLGLTWSNKNQGGYGSASWQQLTPPPAYGTPVTIVSEGVHVFEGKVASSSLARTGEKLIYNVECVGRFAELADDETYEAVFVHRDLSAWQTADCGNWAAAPHFRVNVATEGSLAFSWPDTDKLIVHQSDPDEAGATAYDHIGNAVPRYQHSDFAWPATLWTAAYYVIGGGLSPRPITSFSFDAYWDLRTPKLDAMQTPDYANPIGPADEKYGHRFSRYPRINYWTDFYGLDHAPATAFVGIYGVNDAADLPVDDPWAMRNDPHLLHLFDGRTSHAKTKRVTIRLPRHRARFETEEQEPFRLTVHPGTRMVVIYATYKPVRLPVNLSTRYSVNADHIIRTKWVAVNRIYAEPGEYVELSNLAIRAQHFTDDDVGAAIRLVVPGASVPAMRLSESDPKAPTTSIVVPPFTTRLAAIESLLALYPAQMCWGVWEDGRLVVAHTYGSVTIPYGPGVEIDASLDDEGAVDYALVAYSPAAAEQPSGMLVVNTPALMTVTADGDVSYPPLGWQPAEGDRVAFVDATSDTSGAKGAERMGQLACLERLPGRWSGTIILTGIAGASTIRPGYAITCGQVTGALITSTTCDAEQDRVTLELGSTGYVGRFPASVPGRPATARPRSQRRLTRLDLRLERRRRK
jgi:hypothetical protein